MPTDVDKVNRTQGLGMTGKIIKLKTDPKVFQGSWDEVKTYEIRVNDRDFQVRDTLILLETEFTGEEMKAGKPLEYTGRSIAATVYHILDGEYGLKDGWCVMAVSLDSFYDD